MDTNLAYAMAKIMKIRNVGDYSRYVGHTDRHPLVSVIDYAEVSPVRHSLNNYSVYGIFFHDEAEIDLAYGCGKYDYKKGTVICVAPGVINTDMVQVLGQETLDDLAKETPLGRLGTPEDIAYAVSFFASERAGFITGQVLTADGGFIV